MSNEKNIIVHVCSKEAWQEALKIKELRAPSLESEGFIHCSEIGTILRVANSNWLGRRDLIILMIDTTKVVAPIKFEPDPESGILYPHIYGSINLDSIIEVKEFLPKEDGSFDDASVGVK